MEIVNKMVKSGGEKSESAGKGSRAEKEGSWGRLTEEIQKDPTAQHDPGIVFHAGKSNKCLVSDVKRACFS